MGEYPAVTGEYPVAAPPPSAPPPPATVTPATPPATFANEGVGEPPFAGTRPPAGEPPFTGESSATGSHGRHGRRAVKRTRGQRILREIIELLIIIVVAVIITTLLRTFVVDQYEIPTGSMEPTIEIGDRLFAEKVSYRFDKPAQGDIVTFHDPTRTEAAEDRVLIKRCIAVGGQVVDLVNGQVVVNGVALSEPYTHGQASNPLSTMDGVEIEYPYTVPANAVWVMGDNRMDSSDSRFFGPVSRDKLIGKALFRIWPLDRIGAIDS
jgi:signal peptidase I